ncbi:hypothetical protein [Micromonospora endophytica]|uniref:hypothetical protein n=1 Tax=Micromonospora endophytica TaxID=515350 RepID=UPI001C32ABBD|nr:hypothetical protein [Micromonospora endophytica]BCJ58689.1 hypothetical protein Jiend_21110 [Micromonospora endophytica]
MNRVTGNRATRDPEDGLPAEARPDPRTPVVTPPQPRAVPGGGEAPGHASPPAVQLEPTTGAPVDALPRRVPVRPAGHRYAPDAATPDDDDAFWAPIEEVHWDGTPVRPEATGDTAPWWRRAWPKRRRRAAGSHPPDPLPGLAALVGLSLAATFFAWVSAGPFWVAVGHATSGTVVVTECSGGGLSQRCRGIFAAADDAFRSHGVRISGVPAHRTAAGEALPARVTGPDGGTAYVDRGAGVHLRWLLGLLAVLGCGVGIARWTGATRLSTPRARRRAVIASLAGPLAIMLGFLASAW